ncbi:unnamed protein product [Ambrosiozyma monospora]|uniref:Unnamed protein product n=1 Tax=Ambrosiozyma monospora TaxID=43982 RepID=A0ACB5T500_AMBMO|nr:unnamed protein product [Ambrosiozyma monospora]
MSEDFSAIEERVKVILLNSKAKVQLTRSPLASHRITQHLTGKRPVPKSRTSLTRTSLPLKKRKISQSFKPDANKSDSSIKVDGNDSAVVEPKDVTMPVKKEDADGSLALERLEVGWSCCHLSFIREFQKQKEARTGYATLSAKVDRMIRSLGELRSSTSGILANKSKHKEHNKTEAKMLLFEDLAKKHENETKDETTSAHELVELHNSIFGEPSGEKTEFDKFFELLWESNTEPWYKIHEELRNKIENFQKTLEILRDLMKSEETAGAR